MTEVKVEVDFVKMSNDIAEIKTCITGDNGLVHRVNKLECGIPLISATFSAIGAVFGALIGVFKS